MRKPIPESTSLISWLRERLEMTNRLLSSDRPLENKLLVVRGDCEAIIRQVNSWLREMDEGAVG